MTLRGRMESPFAAWGRFIVDRRWAAIVSMLVLTAVLGGRLPQIEVDNSPESFLRRDDPERLRYERFRAQFDRDDRIIVIVDPPQIFDLGFLRNLERFHRDLEADVPYVSDVTSLINARNTRGQGDELIVEELLASWPRDAADLEALRRRVLANPLFVNVLIADNERYTAVVLKPFTYSTLDSEAGDLADLEAEDDSGGGEAEPAFLSEAESRRLVDALRSVIKRHEAPDFRLHAAGGPLIDSRLTAAMTHDSLVFTPLACVVVIGLLLILFRRPSGVFLPLAVVSTSAVSGLGILVWLGIPYSVMLNILPAFLLVVGTCDSIHILVIVYQRLATGEQRREAIAQALGHSGLPVVMTSVTTACGLLSFSAAELLPIAHLGVVAPIGILLAMLYTLVLLPALLAVVPLRSDSRPEETASRESLDRLLVGMGNLSTSHPIAVLVVTGLLIVIGLDGLARLRFAHDPIRWFPARDPLRVASELIDRNFRGASTLEVLIHTGREGGLYDPATLLRIEEAMRYCETLAVGGHPVSKALSIVDVVKEIHQALNQGSPDFRVVPEDRRLIAQELLLFENSGSDDLTELADAAFETARMTVRAPWADAMLYPAFLEQVEGGLRQILGPESRFEFTGGTVVFSQVFRGVILSMARSYAFALAVITPLLILLIGNIRRGLLAMIPNLIPIYLVLCLMGWLGIPLDASTMLIGAIILGLAVDDTIHFMHKFNRYYEETGDAPKAVLETLTTTGVALLFTSLLLALGFLIFVAGYLRITFWYGLLSSFATAIAFLADVLLAPALMTLAVGGGAPQARRKP